MKTALDRIDVALLRTLQNNGRASNKELAASVGLAPSSTHGRVRRLLEAGVVRGVSAEIAPEALGIGLQALVFIRLRTHNREEVSRAWEQLRELPEAVGAWYVGGDDDILLHVAVRDANHLRDLVLDELPERAPVDRLRTEIIFQHHRAPPPIYTDGG
jgi:DNA-binding Lrp family transcriptional regulator